jgi:hypothetical protein
VDNKPEQYHPLTREELNKLAGEELPERVAMALIRANVAAPINAIAQNVLSDNSVASVPSATYPLPSSELPGG